ncbi:hypothetical protein C3B43_29370 [Mycobacterium kansasii]|nr:hypothetical protein C3B43_29370 [Mycobacterium kansasii]
MKCAGPSDQVALGGWLGWPRGGAVARALLTRLTSAWRIGRLRILLPRRLRRESNRFGRQLRVTRRPTPHRPQRPRSTSSGPQAAAFAWLIVEQPRPDSAATASTNSGNAQTNDINVRHAYECKGQTGPPA